MKSLKIVSLAMASLMAVSLVGCGPVEDPKVRFMRECKQSLTPDECQQLAYNKSQEEQARMLRDKNYTQAAPGYAPGYAAPAAPVVVQAAPQSTFVDSAAGAVVGGVAGAMIGNAMSNRSTQSDRDYERDRQYRDQQAAYHQQQQFNQQQQYRQQQYQQQRQYSQPTQQAYQAPKQTTTAPVAGAFSRNKPAVQQTSYNRPAPKTSYKPATVSRPAKSPMSRPSTRR